MAKTVSLEAVRSTVKAMAARKPSAQEMHAKRPLAPTVTISRQAGVGAGTVTGRLVNLLNQREGGGGTWIEYDRQLVERIAADHNLARELVARFDERDRSWFEHFTGGIIGSATGTDMAMKSAQTIRALAWVGRAVIVGRGGQSILAGMKHVIHVRLFASDEWRARRYACEEGISHAEAELAFSRMDAERARYVKQHFGNDVGNIALYDIILNMARISTDCAAELISRAVEDRSLD